MRLLTSKRALLLSAIIVLLLISGSFYFGYYVPNQPQYILNNAVSDTLTATQTPSMQLQSTVTSGKGTAALQMTYQGTQSTTGALNLSVKATSPATATFTLQSTDGKKFFIKGNGLENTPKLFSSDSTLAPLAHAKTDQWYGIDHNPLASSMKNSLDFWQLRFQGNDIKKYRDAYNSHRFLIVQQVLSPQKLANQQSMHYKVSIDSQRFNAFVKAYTASKPSNTDTLARLRNIHIEGKPFEVWIAAKNKTDVIIQLATPHIHGQSYTKLTPVAPSTAAVKEPRDTKTLAELQKDYDDEIAAQQAAKAAAAATSSSSSKKNVSSTPGFDTWAQEYNFQNYVLPNLW